MIRRCDGNDPNLIRDVPAGESADHWTATAAKFPWWVNASIRPCDCGKVFNDVDYSVIYPHRAV